MASWVTLDLSDALPAGTDTIISSVSSAASTLGTALGTLATVVDLLATFSVPFSDPYAATLEAVQDAIDALTSITASQQVATFTYVNLARPQSFSSWIGTVVASFNDDLDTDRPQFAGSDTCLVLITAGANSPGDLIDAVIALFSALEIEAGFPSDYPDLAIDAPSPGSGQYPDWHGVSMGMMLAPVGRLLAKLNEVKALFEPAIADALDSYAAALQARSDQLSTLADELQELADQLTALSTLGGAQMLVIRLDGADTADLTAAISSAENAPDFGDDAYIAGVAFCFSATGGAVAADFMASLFGGPT